MKTETLSFSKKAGQLATGLALGAAVLAFSATSGHAEDSLFGDTAQQSDYNLEYGDNPYYGRTIVARKSYHYDRRYRGRYARYRTPFYGVALGPRFGYRYSRYRSHYIRYHDPFADPFYSPFGYGGYGGFGFGIRIR